MSLILVPNDILKLNDPQVTCSFIAAKMVLPDNGLQNLITVDNIGYLLYGDNYTKAREKQLRESLNALCEKWNFKKFAPSKYLLNWKENFEIKKGIRASRIESDTFISLLNTGNRNRFALIHHLCSITMSLNYNVTFAKDGGGTIRSVVGFMPQSFFAQNYGVATSTIAGYNKILEDMKIIYIIRTQYNPMDEYPISNIYSLYEDKKYADKYFKKCDVIQAGAPSPYSNYLRSIAQRYNKFINRPEQRTKEEAEKLLQDIRDFNEVHPDRQKPTILIELYLTGGNKNKIKEMVGELTDVQKQKIELGLATYQDFLLEKYPIEV